MSFSFFRIENSYLRDQRFVIDKTSHMWYFNKQQTNKLTYNINTVCSAFSTSINACTVSDVHGNN